MTLIPGVAEKCALRLASSGACIPLPEAAFRTVPQSAGFDHSFNPGARTGTRTSSPGRRAPAAPALIAARSKGLCREGVREGARTGFLTLRPQLWESTPAPPLRPRKWGCGGGYGTVTLNRALDPCSGFCRQSVLPSAAGKGRLASRTLQTRNANNILNRKGVSMFRHISKAISQICLALTLVVAAAVSAQAGGPMSFDVTRCATSPSRGGNQIVEFDYFANNI